MIFGRLLHGNDRRRVMPSILSAIKFWYTAQGLMRIFISGLTTEPVNYHYHLRGTSLIPPDGRAMRRSFAWYLSHYITSTIQVKLAGWVDII